MNSRLLLTKFHIPSWRDTSVSRPLLIKRLNAGLHENRKLTLTSAPAGYGKTTLITEWVHSWDDDNLRVAWLSLDKQDNELTRFLTYCLAAFQRSDPSLGEKIQPFLERPQLPPFNLLLDELVNELSTFNIPIVFILDDYHVITNPQIHEALEYFLEYLPAPIHLVITSRQDPPLPLARLRARGQMTEIRARDLRFTMDEICQFLTDSMKLVVSEESARALEERTEGWAVGLQLAGLALQSQTDPSRFIESFRGSHRYVLDFLAEEVIRQQGEDVRSFLIQTSILERFNAELCCAVTGRSDAQEMISQLEQANLFIVPLDDERVWYRYHHLFSDYLRILLTKPEQVLLYKKASKWHESNDLMIEAVQYVLASEDSDLAVEVIGRALTNNATWSGGNIALLTSWLEALPLHAFINQPQLSLNASRILYLSGRFEQAEKYIEETEAALKSMSLTPETEQMFALAALYRGSIAAVRGDMPLAVEKITFAQNHLDPNNHLAQARAFFSLGVVNEIAHQSRQAIENYLLSSQAAQRADVLFLAIHAKCAAANVHIRQGSLSLAEQTCQEAIKLAEGARIPALGLAQIILGGILLDRNQLEAAEEHLQTGITLSREGGLMDDVILGMMSLSHLYAVLGKTDDALEYHQKAGSILRGFGVPRMSLLSAVYLARLQIFLGQQQPAWQWAQDYHANRESFNQEFADLTLVRVLLAAGELEPIPSILQPLLTNANETGRIKTSIEIMLLFVLYHCAKKETQIVLDWLEKSVRLAAPEGYVRVFLDEGQLILPLLPKVRSSAPKFVDDLMGMKVPETKDQTVSGERLIDPLSEQELRVLDLVVAGKSNQEIADELFISVGTAKWHVHNILKKMGVSNRPQAIARARSLGL